MKLIKNKSAVHNALNNAAQAQLNLGPTALFASNDGVDAMTYSFASSQTPGRPNDSEAREIPRRRLLQPELQCRVTVAQQLTLRLLEFIRYEGAANLESLKLAVL